MFGFQMKLVLKVCAVFVPFSAVIFGKTKLPLQLSY